MKTLIAALLAFTSVSVLAGPPTKTTTCREPNGDLTLVADESCNNNGCKTKFETLMVKTAKVPAAGKTVTLYTEIEIGNDIEVNERVRSEGLDWRFSDITIRSRKIGVLPTPYNMKGDVTRLSGVFNCTSFISGGDPLE